MQISGKLLILAMLLVALMAASASWWFRYSATHHTAQFWGPEAARLIRDAPKVTLRSYDPAVGADADSSNSSARDISNARGLIHLRNALLEDSSYDWSAKTPTEPSWNSSLVFEASAGAEPRAVILFSPDFNWAADGTSDATHRPIVS